MLMIRHNRLLPPYDDYRALNVTQLDDLALHRVSPDIAALPADFSFTETMRARLTGAEYLVCSSAPRTHQTSRAMASLLGIAPDVRVDPLLDEIVFLPSALMETPEENPLDAVRERLYAASLGGRRGAESADSLDRRLSGILDRYHDAPAVLFSHGFLMRLMESYVVQGCNIGLALREAGKMRRIEYLDAIDIHLERE